jgi:hypothetical protein
VCVCALVVLFCFHLVLRVEPRTWCMLSASSVTEPHPQSSALIYISLVTNEAECLGFSHA